MRSQVMESSKEKEDVQEKYSQQFHVWTRKVDKLKEEREQNKQQWDHSVRE